MMTGLYTTAGQDHGGQRASPDKNVVANQGLTNGAESYA